MRDLVVHPVDLEVLCQIWKCYCELLLVANLLLLVSASTAVKDGSLEPRSNPVYHEWTHHLLDPPQRQPYLHYWCHHPDNRVTVNVTPTSWFVVSPPLWRVLSPPFRRVRLRLCGVFSPLWGFMIEDTYIIFLVLKCCCCCYNTYSKGLLGSTHPLAWMTLSIACTTVWSISAPWFGSNLVFHAFIFCIFFLLVCVCISFRVHE